VAENHGQGLAGLENPLEKERDMNPRAKSGGNSRIRDFRAQAAWVVRTTWSISPNLLIGILFLSFLTNLLPAALAWIGKQIINAVADLIAGGSGGIQTVIPWLVLGFAVTAASEIFGSLTSFLKHRLGENLLLRLSRDILEHAATLDVSQLEDLELQDVFERVQKNPAMHFSQFLSRLINLFAGLVQMLSLVIILYAVEPLILVLLLPILLPYMYSKWRHSRKVYKKEYSRATKRRWAGYFASTLTGRHSAPEVKILGLSPKLIHQYGNLLREFVKEDRKLILGRTIMEMTYAMVLGIVTYLLMGRIVGQIFSKALTIGDLTLFIAVSARLRTVLSQVAESASGAVAELLYIADLNMFFAVQPIIAKKDDSLEHAIRGKIEFRDVRFAYPGSDGDVIRGISFTIEPGETVALVGENGAGKSTLVKLLARLYDPTEGAVLIDGIDTRRISPDCLQRQLTFVLQTFNRYEATAFDNIAFGNIAKGMTIEDVDRVVEKTGIRRLIEDMPQGYETMLGRRFGVFDLSGGMWQKIALARAFARDQASLLILDEPTASLDARAEYELFRQFATLAEGRTTILISHRFSTVRLAARIIVLDKGCIAETGTHEELIREKGRYAELYELHMRQMKG
jgi:ATP-binding cassette, subfamily B, bacterial